MLSQSCPHGACCWNQFPSNLLKIFSSIFIRDIGLLCSFPVVSMSGFGIGEILASQNVWGSVSSASIFLEELVKDCISSTLNMFVKFTAETICAWAFFFFFPLRSFSFNLSTYYRSIQIFSSSSVNFSNLCFLRSCQFHLDYLIC